MGPAHEQVENSILDETNLSVGSEKEVTRNSVRKSISKRQQPLVEIKRNPRMFKTMYDK